MPVVVNLTLCLPADGYSVPIVRHIFGHSMREIGVLEECATAAELALTEACTNVLDHSTDACPYEVIVGIDDRVCSIRVKDLGRGFDVDDVTPPHGIPMSDSAESGRGIAMMHALVDRVQFVSRPEEGTVVLLEKELEFDDAHPLRQLEAQEPMTRR